MSAQRFIGLSALLCVAVSCATHNSPNTQATAPAAPKASVFVTYSGGMLNRRADVTFKVDQPAYTMVAHLGGDGQIEVLYPRDARESGRVPGGKYFRTRPFSAYYDALPELYSFAMTRYRSLGAQLDSYDGIGHAYVFVIASRYPLRFDRISDFGLWDDFEAENYRVNPDPRESVKRFAEIVAGGHEYTLKFARSMGNLALTNSVDQLFDCAYFSTFGLGAFGGPSWTFSSLAFQGSTFGTLAYSRVARQYASGCGSQYTSYYPVVSYAYTPNPNLAPTPTPTGPARGPHFGRRIGTTPGVDPNRPTYTPPGTVTSTESAASPDFAPRSRRSFGTRGTDVLVPSPTREPVYDAPRSIPSRPGSWDATRTTTPREAPTDHSSPQAGQSQPRTEPARSRPRPEAARPQPAREAPPAQPPPPRPSPDERKPKQ